MVAYTSPEAFKRDIATSDLPILAQFSADWCGPCRAIAPMVEAAASEYDGRVKILKLNLDECGDLARKYDVQVIPALVLFQDGTPIDQFKDARTLSRLSFFLDKHIGEIW